MADTVDAAGWYTGPQHLYPNEDPYITVTKLEMARPWSGVQPSSMSKSATLARSTSHGSFAAGMASFSRSGSLSHLNSSVAFGSRLGDGSRPSTPTATLSASNSIYPETMSIQPPLARSSHLLTGPSREILRRNPDPTWITVPGSRQAPAVGARLPILSSPTEPSHPNCCCLKRSLPLYLVVSFARPSGVPGPGLRKGRGPSNYDITYHPVGFGSLTRTRSSIGNNMLSSTLNSSMNSLGGSPSVRALRREAAAARPRPKSNYDQPLQRPSTGEKPSWMKAPGIGFGEKFYYRG